MKNKLDDIDKEDLISLLTQQGLLLRDMYKELGVCEGTFKRKLKEFNINLSDYIDYRAKYNVFAFDNIDTEEKAYWLGFLYADGNVRSFDGVHNNNTISLELAFIDYDHLIKFKTFMNDQRPDSIIRIRERFTAKGNKQKLAAYDICNSHLRQSLINTGCVPAKSLILKFPDENIFKGEELVYDFIRGYVDGDGCLSKTNDNRLFISIRGTFDFLSGIKNYFPQFSKVYSEVNSRTTKVQYKLECCSNKADKVAYKLYEGSNIYLDRKFNKFTALCKLHNSETSGNNGEGCDANTVITDSIAKGESAS